MITCYDCIHTSLLCSGSDSGTPEINITILKGDIILSSDKECVIYSRSQAHHSSLCTSDLSQNNCNTTPTCIYTVHVHVHITLIYMPTGYYYIDPLCTCYILLRMCVHPLTCFQGCGAQIVCIYIHV